MKTIDDVNFMGKRALIRVDYNVPLDENFKITDPTRIEATVKSITKIIDDGGSVILMSHLGRPKNGPEEKFSLKHLLPYLNKVLMTKVKFAHDCIGEEAFIIAKELKSGEVLLLENLRFYKEEEKGDVGFAEKLSKLGDVYVNDAFGTAHRAHASTAVIAQFFPGSKMFGYVMSNEIAHIRKLLINTNRPFTAILGGAKVSGKIQIIENLLDKVDNLLIGGGMTYTFIKALGGSTGNSLIEDDFTGLAAKTMETAALKNVKLHLPSDTIIADDFNNDAEKMTCLSGSIPDGWMGLDIGEKTMDEFASVIMNSKTILWNGPMGVFEMSNFEKGTRFIAETIAKATANGAFSLIGGGDSVAAINKFGLESQVSYISTGGGAMLEYLEGKILPGIAAVEQN